MVNKKTHLCTDIIVPGGTFGLVVGVFSISWDNIFPTMIYLNIQGGFGKLFVFKLCV